MDNIRDIIEKIDWELLARQREALYLLQDSVIHAGLGEELCDGIEALEGVLNFLSDLDAAAEDDGLIE